MKCLSFDLISNSTYMIFFCGMFLNHYFLLASKEIWMNRTIFITCFDELVSPWATNLRSVLAAIATSVRSSMQRRWYCLFWYSFFFQNVCNSKWKTIHMEDFAKKNSKTRTFLYITETNVITAMWSPVYYKVQNRCGSS